MCVSRKHPHALVHPCRAQSSCLFVWEKHQLSQYDDVIHWEPAAPKRVCRWQCCASEPAQNPVNPVLWNSGTHTLSSRRVTGSQLLLIHVSFCWFFSFTPLKDFQIKKRNNKWILNWVLSIWAWRKSPHSSQGGAVKDQSMRLSISQSIKSIKFHF